MNFEKFKAKLRYKFDNLMSKGAVALVAMLFLATAAVIVLAALVALAFGNGTFNEAVWAGIMHTIDAGTITGTDTGNVPFLIIMSVVTLCGLFVTSILIGIITTGFEEKLHSLRKGNSQVIEKNHTIILGFNENIFTIISELILANESSKDECIVVLSPEAKETVEEAIAGQIADYKTTRVICRTGATTDVNMLNKCSLSTCRSIIINENDDFITTKAILAINNFFEESSITEMPCIVASVNDSANYSAADIAGEGNVEVLLASDIISRIIAQTCRQSGLSEVMTELFDFGGDELYFEKFPQLAGKKFAEILNMFDKAIVFGYKRKDKIYLNPDMGTVIEADDTLLLLMEDNGAVQPVVENGKKGSAISKKKAYATAENKQDNILVLGTNAMLKHILRELDEYSSHGSTVTIADENATEYLSTAQTYKNIVLTAQDCDTNDRQELDVLVNEKVDNIVLLSKDDEDTEHSDAQILLKLIHLRDISEKKGYEFNITSEMKNPSNQKLAKVAKVNDFVIGSYIVNMIMAQISENRDLAEVFYEIMQPEGNEIYIRSIERYVDNVEEMDFYSVSQLVKDRGEIAIGYKKSTKNGHEIIVNPNKADKIAFTNKDSLIVLSR